MFKVILIIYGIGVLSGSALTRYARKVIKAYKKAEERREEELDERVKEFVDQLKGGNPHD